MNRRWLLLTAQARSQGQVLEPQRFAHSTHEGMSAVFAATWRTWRPGVSSPGECEQSSEVHRRCTAGGREPAIPATCAASPAARRSQDGARMMNTPILVGALLTATPKQHVDLPTGVRLAYVET